MEKIRLFLVMVSLFKVSLKQFVLLSQASASMSSLILAEWSEDRAQLTKFSC